jgi:hypothetical protein
MLIQYLILQYSLDTILTDILFGVLSLIITYERKLLHRLCYTLETLVILQLHPLVYNVCDHLLFLYIHIFLVMFIFL